MPIKDQEKRKAYFLQYDIKRREEKRIADRKNYWLKRDTKLAQNKAWRGAHPNYSREHSRKWRSENPEKQRAIVEAYRNRCNQLQNKRKRQLRETNPSLVRIMDKVYKYRRRTLGTIAKDDIEFVITRDNWRCGICNRRVRKTKFSIDHILPISQGGDNARSNLRLAHIRCNAIRRDIGPAQLRLPT